MCTCASCKYTDEFSGKGFAAWPRGKPAGRSAERDYAAHVRHGLQWGRSAGGAMHQRPECGKVFRQGGTRREDPHVRYKWPTYGADDCQTTEQYVALFLRQNGLKRQAPVKTPARPAQACKPEQHFPELDRQPEAGTVIYAMANRRKSIGKNTPELIGKKQSAGRPPLPGRRVVVKLEETHITRAQRLGSGNVAAGIRKALSG